MFFMFAFIALLTIIVTNKLSNTYEKLYYKKETENENDRDNANLGDTLCLILITINRKTNISQLIINYRYLFYICIFAVMLLKKESYQLSF